MKKPQVIEIYTDNGALSHYALIDTNTGEKLWSQNPEECKSMGFPVKFSYLEENINGDYHRCKSKSSKFIMN